MVHEDVKGRAVERNTTGKRGNCLSTHGRLGFKARAGVVDWGVCRYLATKAPARTRVLYIDTSRKRARKKKKRVNVK